jgi:uncharacterized protein YkwD
MTHIRIFAIGVLAALALAVIPASAPATPRESMLRQINAMRAYVGVHPLRLSGSLNRSSYRYSRYLMRRDRFGHASTIRASRRFRVLGEVLEMHRGRRAQVGATFRAWMRSPGHRHVLLSRRFYWIGLGRVAGRFHGRRATIWVGQLGRR